MEPFVANTDPAWFDYLATRAESGRLDEANFWSPRSTRALRRMTPGEPVFLRRKRPDYQIAGYGFFAAFDVLDLGAAWRTFDWKNGDATEVGFLQRIGAYRGLDLLDPSVRHEPLGCTVLRDVHLWPRSRWIPWRREVGWKDNAVQGATERDPARIEILLATVAEDAARVAVRAELEGSYHLVGEDTRRTLAAERVVREGQGAFRARLLRAYGAACAISGEHTEPVLDAAHIQPYLGGPSNHVQNGLLLTKEFHVLFDLGLVGVTPDYKVRVHRRIHERWNNGRRYYAYEGRPLAALPKRPADRPSPEALAWHLDTKFARA